METLATLFLVSEEDERLWNEGDVLLVVLCI